MTNFYSKYIEEVTKNDTRTLSSVDAIMGRIDKLLADNAANNDPARVSGLVVGRVQSGKTRNYVGLALKAADAGWNVIIVLTSAIKALAEQTEGRMMRDFKESGIKQKHAERLNFLDNAFNEDASSLEEGEGFFYWGVAMKERASLDRIVKWMNANKQYAPLMKVLVIDDEADNATPNSNAGQNTAAEDPEDLVADMCLAMRECEADDFNALADWLEGLLGMEAPDEADGTDVAKAYLALKDYLSVGGNINDKKTTILFGENGNFRFRNLLGLDLTPAEAASEDGSWQTDVAEEPLYLKANQFFSGMNYEPYRRASDFIKVLKAVFQIVQDRSSVNKAIVSLVDKLRSDAPFTYPFARCAYIAYTATPYACILNERPDQTVLYADFIASIEKSPQYFGLDEIYGRNLKEAEKFIPRMDIVRSIPDSGESDEKDMIIDPLVSAYGGNSQQNANAHMVKVNDDLSCVYDGHKGIVWQTLKDAIAWAFCCAAARRLRRLEILAGMTDDNERAKFEKKISPRWTTMLFNIHQKTAIHAKTKEILENYLEWLFDDNARIAAFLEECEALWEKETTRFDVAKFDALFNKDGYGAPGSYGQIAPAPSWDEIKVHFQYFFSPANRHVIIINNANRQNQELYTQANGAPPISGDHLWFICGGNTIARGLTLEGLVASYFDRIRKTVAVDTMTQMGRWFGYRLGYELLPRVWMTPASVLAMKEVAVIEDKMHTSIKENFDNGFSPSDQEHYQLVYYCGRRLTGRDKAKRRLDIGIGTGGGTEYLSVVPAEVSALNGRIGTFLEEQLQDYALTPEEQTQREAQCLYGRYTLWRGVPKSVIVDFLKDAAALSPEASCLALRGLVREIENAKNTNWNVVIANGKAKGGEDQVKHICGEAYRLGEPAPTSIVNGVAHYVSPHLYLPYYADIDTAVLTEVDCHFLRELLPGYIIPSLHYPLPPSIEQALAPYPSDKEKTDENLRERFDKFLDEYDAPPHNKPFPKGMRELFKGKEGGYNTRSSTNYMAKVFDTAHAYTPTLQFYFIKPPVDGTPPLSAISFHWPKHEPERFIAFSAGLQDKPQPPTRTRFCEAVEEVLTAYDFPMPTMKLRSTIIEKLGPGCTENFFNDNIAQIPNGRQYEPVPNRNAYMPLGWGGDKGVEARLDATLLSAALQSLLQDQEEHKAADLFAQVLAANPKLADFFRANDASDMARFNARFTSEVLAENHIAKTCGKPVKYQYQV